eukprot:TRINITY_DN10321_c0_g1_i1.p1 TRINITY_DN10321_c0_g1~~TRINITY_DN10321_c0_g1_i1.p1  ORF type:complete len:220 (+),score=39.65 TRINITY_DN10321_c0_g1_i1:150-809(+)
MAGPCCYSLPTATEATPDVVTISPTTSNFVESSSSFDPHSFASKPNEYDYLFKIILIGSSGVGKTSLLTRFVDDRFDQEQVNTIGVDFKIKTLDVDGKKIKLQLWDTAGQERYKTVTNAYFRGSHGIILAYDTTSQTTFEGIEHWLGEVHKYAPRNVVKLIVGTKCDLSDKRQVETSHVASFAEQHKTLFIESSAYDATNVSEAFNLIVKQIKQRIRSS